MVAESLLKAVPEVIQHSCWAWTCWARLACCSCLAGRTAASGECSVHCGQAVLPELGFQHDALKVGQEKLPLHQGNCVSCYGSTHWSLPLIGG